ncbi:MAG: hypothetical protein AVO38_13415 [delta proteobacterium ML8_D]|nr:MAG: hypothetical protein AVO38_13415 [delta proteobacterium ML8_D]
MQGGETIASFSSTPLRLRYFKMLQLKITCLLHCFDSPVAATYTKHFLIPENFATFLRPFKQNHVSLVRLLRLRSQEKSFVVIF